jgi:hypothetical protein
MSDAKEPAETPHRPTFQLFDLVGKYIYQTASAAGTVNSLRGLYKRVEIPPEITLALGRTESVRKYIRLERIQGDLIFEGTPKNPQPEEAQDFLMEFQIRKDRKLGLRVFNYGQAHAQRRAALSEDGSETRQQFPEALIIYLGPPPYPPETLLVRTVIHGSEIGYEIPVYSVLAHTLEEMERDRLHLLMPFQLLKHRKEAASSKTSKERRKKLALEALGAAEAIGTVLERGCTEGIITESDDAMLSDVMETLYNELYESQEGDMDFAEQLKLKGFKLKYPEWKAEKDRFEAEAFKQGEQKILSLLEQGKTLEQVKTLLAQEAAGSTVPSR